MKKMICPKTDEIKKDISRHDSQEHLKECKVCQEDILVHRWLNRFRRLSYKKHFQEKSMPLAAKMWADAFKPISPKAKRELTKRILRPMRIYQHFVYWVLAGFCLFFISNYRHGLSQFFKNNSQVLVLKGFLFNLINNLGEIFGFIMFPLAGITVLACFLFLVNRAVHFFQH